jgi:hypothetical protein
MVSREQVKILAGAGVAGAVLLTWALAFRTGWASNDWNDEWQNPSDLRGKTVYIGNKEVETTEERDKRLKKLKLLNGELGEMKKSVLGDRRSIRGNDIVPEAPDLPEGFDYNPREACLQMKLEYPERYGKLDCMSERYDTPEPWWKVGIFGQ